MPVVWRAMQILSVQTGHARDIPHRHQVHHTGIDKQPVAQIEVARDGVDGDTIVDTDNHGGPGQAVYLYARSDYAAFEEALSVEPFPPGSFGENVTVDAWPHDPIRIGDRFDFDGVVLEVTAPRIPCSKFAARVEELLGPGPAEGWVKRFVAARRPGWYCRVLTAGTLTAGREAVVTPAPGHHITGLDLWDLHYAAAPDPGLVARALDSPIAERAREDHTAA